jgi:pyruvate,water dikinase
VIVAAPLSLVEEEGRYGGKAVSLGRSLRHGLPVPDGFALDVAAVDRLAAGRDDEPGSFQKLLDDVGGRAAVRSSAVGEDAKDASFAGQHVTILNATSVDSLIDAVRAIHQSAHSQSALSYRERMGIHGSPRIAIVVQRLIHADSAGVLFTRNPTTGVSERLIEAAWGLGESVVSGAVVPDSYRMADDGRILERTIGVKDCALTAAAGGGTSQVAVEPSKVRARVLSDMDLAELQRLARSCEAVFGAGLDIEWAFEAGRLFLLQCRPITRLGV